jgi:hypothetical protein
MTQLKLKLVKRGSEGYALAIDKGLINAGIIDPSQKEIIVELKQAPIL